MSRHAFSVRSQDDNATQRLVRAIVRGAGGSVVVLPSWLTVDEGMLVRSDAPDGILLELICVEGHDPDDPAPMRHVCCRRCGTIIERRGSW